MNHELNPKFKLRWQEGYGILTLRKEELASVCRYIDNQEEHHRRGTLSALLETTETAEDDGKESPLKGAEKSSSASEPRRKRLG